jgi:hypothetical protein
MPAAIAEDSVLGRINALLAEVGGEKRAAAKKRATEMGLSGSGADDPGGRSGPSTHPTARADSDTGEAPLGARGKENEEDVKEDRPAAVDAQGAARAAARTTTRRTSGPTPRRRARTPRSKTTTTTRSPTPARSTRPTPARRRRRPTGTPPSPSAAT